MDTFMIMLKNVLIFVLLAVPGYLLVRGKKLTQKDCGGFSLLLTNVCIPFMILSSALKLEFSGEFTRSILITGIIGILFTLVMFFATGPMTAKVQDEKTRGIMRFCMIFANNGFIGIPLAKAVFGDGSAVMAYLIILNVINNVMLFTLGIFLVSGDKKTISVKKGLMNPVLISFLIGVALNLLGVGKAVPELQTYATYFSNAVTPLSMVVLGMKLATVPMKNLFGSKKMYYTSFARLIAFPVMGVALMLLLQPISGLLIGSDAIIGFFVAFAMPAAGLATAFADQYQGDVENAVIGTLGSTILSILTIPVLYWALRLLV